MTIYSLDIRLPKFEPVCCSMSCTNCYFLTCIQVSQEVVRWSGIVIIVLTSLYSLNMLSYSYFSVLNQLYFLQFSCSVVPDSLPLHELQHACLPCSSPTPRAYSNSCPLSLLCHPTLSSSVIPFSSCPQSFPASGSFPISQLFTSGGQSTGSFSFNISPSNEYPGLISFKTDWLDLLAVQGTFKSLL